MELIKKLKASAVIIFGSSCLLLTMLTLIYWLLFFLWRSDLEGVARLALLIIPLSLVVYSHIVCLWWLVSRARDDARDCITAWGRWRGESLPLR